jgi:ABC-2 type transport system permease protein
MNDVATVAWKEVRENLARGGAYRRGRALTRTLVFPAAVGLLFGFQAGRAGGSVDSGFAVFFVGMFAMSTAGALVLDAIAGERERHTLETLLASPASDAAILTGKLTAVVGYAWTVALVQLAAIEVGASLGGRAVAAWLIAVVALLSLLETALAATFGIQFSLAAPTVRAAARKQSLYALFVTLLASSINLAVASPGDVEVRVLAFAGGAAFLVAADAALLAVTRRRFRRGRVRLD